MIDWYVLRRVLPRALRRRGSVGADAVRRLFDKWIAGTAGGCCRPPVSSFIRPAVPAPRRSSRRAALRPLLGAVLLARLPPPQVLMRTPARAAGVIVA